MKMYQLNFEYILNQPDNKIVLALLSLIHAIDIQISEERYNSFLRDSEKQFYKEVNPPPEDELI